MSKVSLTVSTPQKVDAVISGGSRGTSYYPELLEKPSIEGKVLVGDVSLEEIKIGVATKHDIDKMFFD